VFTYFRKVGAVSWSLLKGLGITLRYMFSPAVTVQYPFEKLELSDRYRGALAFHPDICIACDMCVRACPSSCVFRWSRSGTSRRKRRT
jgi:formate hydrogenlyase subunit 6/NADH:ubiquinone oxidoreductase subunit I